MLYLLKNTNTGEIISHFTFIKFTVGDIVEIPYYFGTWSVLKEVNSKWKGCFQE